jgi:hypothetical protein
MDSYKEHCDVWFDLFYEKQDDFITYNTTCDVKYIGDQQDKLKHIYKLSFPIEHCILDGILVTDPLVYKVDFIYYYKKESILLSSCLFDEQNINNVVYFSDSKLPLYMIKENKKNIIYLDVYMKNDSNNERSETKIPFQLVYTLHMYPPIVKNKFIFNRNTIKIDRKEWRLKLFVPK